MIIKDKTVQHQFRGTIPLHFDIVTLSFLSLFLASFYAPSGAGNPNVTHLILGSQLSLPLSFPLRDPEGFVRSAAMPKSYLFFSLSTTESSLPPSAAAARPAKRSYPIAIHLLNPRIPSGTLFVFGSMRTFRIRKRERGDLWSFLSFVP